MSRLRTLPCHAAGSVVWHQPAERSLHAFVSCPGLQPFPSGRCKAALAKAKERKGWRDKEGHNPQNPSPHGTGALTCGVGSAEQDLLCLCLQELTGLPGGEEAGAENDNYSALK